MSNSILPASAFSSSGQPRPGAFQGNPPPSPPRPPSQPHSAAMRSGRSNRLLFSEVVAASIPASPGNGTLIRSGGVRSFRANHPLPPTYRTGDTPSLPDTSFGESRPPSSAGPPPPPPSSQLEFATPALHRPSPSYRASTSTVSVCHCNDGSGPACNTPSHSATESAASSSAHAVMPSSDYPRHVPHGLPTYDEYRIGSVSPPNDREMTRNASIPSEEDSVTSSDLSQSQNEMYPSGITVFTLSLDVCGKCGPWEQSPNAANFLSSDPKRHPTLQKYVPYIIGHKKSLEGEWVVDQVWIHDERIKDAFKPLFDKHPAADPSNVGYPFYVFSQNWEEVEKAIESKKNEDVYVHLESIASKIESAAALIITTRQRLLDTRRIAFKLLRTAFVLGEQVVAKASNGSLVIGFLGSIHLNERESTLGSYWDFSVEHVAWTGSRSCAIRRRYQITAYGGDREIDSLNVCPLHLFSDNDLIQQTLMERGRKFESLLRGLHILSHEGRGRDPVNSQEPNHHNSKISSAMLKGRVIVHTQYFNEFECAEHRYSPPAKFLDASDTLSRTALMYLSEGGSHECFKRPFANLNMESSPFTGFCPDDREPENVPWTDQQCMMAINEIRAFSLENKCWYLVDVENLSEPNWRPDLLNTQQIASKDALLSRHAITELAEHGATDLGRFTFLFWGPPGTGKLTTIDHMCEQSSVVPYKLNVATLKHDLTGRVTGRAEGVFKLAMQRCTHLKMPLVISNAQHLFGKHYGGLGHSLTTTTFLKYMKNFQGVVFLTAPTEDSLDKPIIDLTMMRVRFQKLTKEARRYYFSEELKEAEFADEYLDELAENNMTREQIGDLARMAKLLGKHEPNPLYPTLTEVLDDHVQEALDLRNSSVNATTGRSYQRVSEVTTVRVHDHDDCDPYATLRSRIAANF